MKSARAGAFFGGFVFGDTSAVQALTGMDFPDYPTFAGYDLSRPFAQTLVGNFWAAGTFETDRGTLSITDAEDYVFSASLAPAAAPEVAAWAMMVAGFGLIGWVMRKSRVPALA